jgi:hypothetical protein
VVETLTQIKESPEPCELVVSVIGFVGDKMIDLLNMDQDFTTLRGKSLRIKREDRGGNGDADINTENLIQMGVRSIEEFTSIMGLSKALSVYSIKIRI